MTELSSTNSDRLPRLRAALDSLQRIQLRLAALALVLMMLVTVADVVLRYLFNSPIRGSYDFVESMLVVFVFHGMSRAFMTRTNIVIDILDPFFGPRITAVLIRVSDVLTLTTLVIIGWAMSRIALQAFDYGDRKLELQLPLYVLCVVALAGLAGAMLAGIGALFTPPTSPHDDATAP